MICTTKCETLYLLFATSAIMAALRFGAFFVLSTLGGSAFATLLDVSLGLRPRFAGAFLSGSSSSSSTASFSVDFTGFSLLAAAFLDEVLTGAAAFFAGVFLLGAFLTFLAGEA